MPDKKHMEADVDAATQAKRDKYSMTDENNRVRYPQTITRADGSRRIVRSPEEHRDLDKADGNVPENKLSDENLTNNKLANKDK